MPQEEPILFLWALSAWASKVTAYLALRGIPYSTCEQPITQPRPDIAALGVNYRRIPLLSMGRDIYCDTLLILEKLETFYPGGKYKSISADNPTHKALEKLFEKWTDVVVFKPAAATISTDLDLMKDPNFQKDRETLWGRPWSKEAQDALRPAALADMRANFDFLEELLADGRQWVLGTNEGPKLADIHACWIFDWLLMLPGSFPSDFFNETRYPSVFSWRERYQTSITQAKESNPQPTALDSQPCIQKILSSNFQEPQPELITDDPSGLQGGQGIRMKPSDTGYSHSDTGKLIGLNAKEAVISTQSKQDAKEIHIHYPRWNFTFEQT